MYDLALNNTICDVDNIIIDVSHQRRAIIFSSLIRMMLSSASHCQIDCQIDCQISFDNCHLNFKYAEIK
jgi:hypothetical protein